MFRKHLYRTAKGKTGLLATEQSIAHPVSRQELRSELKKGEYLGSTTDGKAIYLYRL